MQWLNRAMLRLHTENTLDREEKIMSEWLKTSLIDIVELIGGGTPKTSKAEYWGGNINWLSVKDFNNENRYVYSTEKTITEEGLNNSSTKLLRKDDIIISARGTVGELSMIPFPMAFNQSCYGIRAKEGIDSTFLYYLIKHSVRKLKAMTHGSVFDTITRDTFANIDVAIPDIEMQQRVAKMLANIDDKVENNQRINNNLSAMAYDIYMHNFFSKKPNAKLKDILTEAEKSAIQVGEAKTSNGEYPFFTSGATILKWNEPFVDGRNCFLNTGGNADVKFYVGKAAYSTDTWSISAKSEMSDYLYLMLFSIKPELDQKFFQGTGLKHLQKPLLKDRPIYVPEKLELEAFNRQVMPMFDIISENTRENQQLTSLRDWLLPMLMNGQATISD